MGMTLFCQHSALVAVLERELAFHKQRADLERRRAEQAVDQLLRLRAGVLPVTPPEPRAPSAAEVALQELLTSSEATEIGDLKLT